MGLALFNIFISEVEEHAGRIVKHRSWRMERSDRKRQPEDGNEQGGMAKAEQMHLEREAEPFNIPARGRCLESQAVNGL